MAAVSFNSNVLSLSAQRRANDATAAVERSFQRLSTGLRINSASDDAAGLAIADKLRVNSKLQTTAIQNLNDGLSVVNIMNGALEQQDALLNRLLELSEQSANGTFSETQRGALNKEYQALVKEFGRIGDTTSFNNINLLLAGRSGDISQLIFQAGLDGGSNSTLRLNTADMGSLSGVIKNLGDGDVTNETMTFDQIAAYWNNNMVRYNVTDSNGKQRELLLGLGIRFSNALFAHISMRSEDAGVIAPPGSWELSQGIEFTQNFNTSTGKYSGGSGVVSFTVNFGDGSTATLGIDLRAMIFGGGAFPNNGETTNIGTTGVESSATALHALEVVKRRKDDVSNLRGQVGASESRLRSAVALLTSSKEVTKAAESRIRDVDVAEESSNLIAQQILQSASTKMIGLANSQPKILLSLLSTS